MQNSCGNKVRNNQNHRAITYNGVKYSSRKKLWESSAKEVSYTTFLDRLTRQRRSIEDSLSGGIAKLRRRGPTTSETKVGGWSQTDPFLEQQRLRNKGHKPNLFGVPFTYCTGN